MFLAAKIEEVPVVLPILSVSYSYVDASVNLATRFTPRPAPTSSTSLTTPTGELMEVFGSC